MSFAVWWVAAEENTLFTHEEDDDNITLHTVHIMYKLNDWSIAFLGVVSCTTHIQLHEINIQCAVVCTCDTYGDTEEMWSRKIIVVYRTIWFLFVCQTNVGLGKYSGYSYDNSIMADLSSECMHRELWPVCECCCWTPRSTGNAMQCNNNNNYKNDNQNSLCYYIYYSLLSF